MLKYGVILRNECIVLLCFNEKAVVGPAVQGVKLPKKTEEMTQLKTRN